MDPLMRKLFQPREAREKLRSMGGIMSSSPDLASTVARFQGGGGVAPTMPRSIEPMIQMQAPDSSMPAAGRPRATRIGDRTFILTEDNRVLDAQTGAPAPAEVADEVRLRLSPQFSTTLPPEISLSGVNPSYTEDRPDRFAPISNLPPMSGDAVQPSAPFDMMQFQDDLSGVARGLVGPPLQALDERFGDSVLSVPSNATRAVDAALDRRMSGDVPRPPSGDAPIPSSEQQTLSEALQNRPGIRGLGGRGDEIAQIEARLEDPSLSEFQREALETRLVGLRQIPGTEGALDAVVDFGGRVLSTPGNLVGQGLSLLGAPDAGAAVSEFFDPAYYDSNSPRYRSAEPAVPAEPGAETPEDEARRMLLRQDRGVNTPAVDAAADPDEAPNATPDNGSVGGDGGGGDGGDLDLNDPATFDTTYDQMLTRLQSVMGTKDENSREKAMANLAMIGLAIAAGQSPNALTNIAQGALTGVKAIRAEQAAGEEQDKALRMAALNAALEQEQGIRAAGAEAARDDLKFQRDIELVREKARLGGGSGRSPRAIEDFVQNVYTEALKAASAVAIPDDMGEAETPEAYAARKANTARQYMSEQFSGTYGPAPSVADDLTEEERQLIEG